MIKRIKIQNYKSIVDLTLDLGRVNVIIGANGCGKTNILEAITFASAANQDKLDNEFLINRGVRVTSPQFMLSAFEELVEAYKTSIFIDIDEQGKRPQNIQAMHIEGLDSWMNLTINKPVSVKLSKSGEELLSQIGNTSSNIDLNKLKRKIDSIEKKPSLPSFLMFSPDEIALRNPNIISSITPLGVRGEGLLQYLKAIIKKDTGKELIKSINEGLSMLDWFDGLGVPEDLLSNEYKLSIGDKYLKESLHFFDQRSTNEGFLFLLFYLTLFNSAETPKFFAIDNIESSFNPKLCTKLLTRLIEIAKKKNKQVILTTHNPYILDGLDLSDDEQRLFVARRNIDGHTKIERIPYRENRNMMLSDLWMSGVIGGLPDNF